MMNLNWIVEDKMKIMKDIRKVEGIMRINLKVEDIMKLKLKVEDIMKIIMRLKLKPENIMRITMKITMKLQLKVEDIMNMMKARRKPEHNTRIMQFTLRDIIPFLLKWKLIIPNMISNRNTTTLLIQSLNPLFTK